MAHRSLLLLFLALANTAVGHVSTGRAGHGLIGFGIVSQTYDIRRAVVLTRIGNVQAWLCLRLPRCARYFVAELHVSWWYEYARNGHAYGGRD